MSLNSNKIPIQLNVVDFGAIGDGTTDNLAAFNAAIAASSSGSSGNRILVPRGTYRLSGPLHINKSVCLEGATPQRYGTADCILRFDAGVDGVIIEALYAGTSGQNAHIKNLTISAAGKTSAAYGVRLLQKATIEGCYVSSWKTNGIIIDTTVVGSNCNSFMLIDCAIDGCDGDGVRITGSDSNAGVLFNCSSRVNGGWGFHDTSLTSNTYLQCHTEANTTGSYRLSNSGPGGMLVNCYAEGDQPASQVTSPAVILGGTFGVPNATNASPVASRTSETYGLLLGGGGGANGCMVRAGNLQYVDSTATMTMSQAEILPYTAGGPLSGPVDNISTPTFSGLTEGQIFTLFNNTPYEITLHDDSDVSGTLLKLHNKKVWLGALENISFQKKGSYAIEIDRSQPTVIVRAGTVQAYSEILGGGASDICIKMGTTVADASVNTSAKLFSVRSGIGGTEVEKLYMLKDGTVLSAEANIGFGKFVYNRYKGFLYDTSGAQLGLWNETTCILGCNVGSGLSSSAYNFQVGQKLYVGLGEIFSTTLGGAAQTGQLISAQGTGASDIAWKIGTSVADASVNATAKLAQFGTGIGGTFVEKAFITKTDLELTTASGAVILKSPDGTRYKITVANGGAISVGAA